MGAYKGPESTLKDAEKTEESFKKGGRTKKKSGGLMSAAAGKKEMKACGGKTACRSDRPARKSGGAVFSAAAHGEPRGKASNY
jgi:hypothetical protein